MFSSYEKASRELTDYIEDCGFTTDKFNNFDMAVIELSHIFKANYKGEIYYDMILAFWDTVDLPTQEEINNSDDVFACVWELDHDNEEDMWYVDTYSDPEWNTTFSEHERDKVIDILCIRLAECRAWSYMDEGQYNIQLQLDYDIVWSYSTRYVEE